ncbi:MAG TPA: tetratricopeptide repeat protein [Pyrinomonadaceae bacterium]|nr:tetratricopeptide repeat protein [Pyrinomonadaceae bacterium]
MSELIDHGSWIYAAIIVLLVSIAFSATIDTKLNDAFRVPQFTEFYRPTVEAEEDQATAEHEYARAYADYERALAARGHIPVVGDNFFKFASFAPEAFYRPLLSISAFYVPLAILVMCAFAPVGSFGLVLRRDYGPVSTCALMAWAAAHLPFAVLGLALNSQSVDPMIYFSLWVASGVLFVLFAAFALRTVLGTAFIPAVGAAAIGLFGFSIGMYVFQYISPWLFSPFILFYAYSYFGGEVRGFGNAFRQRQNFKRFLHNATVNPRDADAHVQLGLIYLQRRQESKALDHLNKAIEIEPNEIDANYELGKIARQKGELQKALDHFSIVVEQDDKHSLSEIWREIGAAYLTAGMYKEAREALERFIERRSYDPEGLYYLGRSLKSLGDNDSAHEAFQKAIESVNGSPDYRRRTIKHWGKLAEKEI